MPNTRESLGPVLTEYGFEGARLEPVTMGNINTTYRVNDHGKHLILQRLNPIFGAEVHHDIEAVTAHLEEQGMVTPRLVRTRSGDLWAEDPFGGVWRVMTLIDGRIHSAGANATLCRSAGGLLGRFHQAVSTLEHSFQSRRPGVHDTTRHMAHLREVLETHRDHEAYDEVHPVARDILVAAGDLPSLGRLPSRIVHGDPKLNNVVFTEQDEAICLIDLDTLSHMSIPVELGDALRSWCNPSGEDTVASSFDCDCFGAALEGYGSAAGKLLDDSEIDAIPVAVETITLELAARFCADALDESYFGWNEKRFESASAHNLHRARSQLSLARSYGKQRGKARDTVARVFRR